MKETIVSFFVIIVVILFAIAHERDIARTCQQQGNSGNAGWTVHIDCNEMKK